MGKMRRVTLLAVSALLASACGLVTLQVPSATMLYVANSLPSTITVYDAMASGNAPPVRTIGGANTGLSTPRDVEQDTAGNIYVTNLATNTVTVFAPGANGNVAPIRTIGGPSTSISGPAALFLGR
ncbi:MAG: hypothetical protein QN168_01225 [Armatimonadota bacterium]|nr:hypothetical protein [Armatimonadota bacterium]